MKRFFTILGLILSFSVAFGQEYPRPQIELDKFVEDLFNLQSANTNYEDLYESLLMLYINPLNLNDASREELRALYILSEEEINNFLTYRAKNGKLLSVYELQAVPGLTLQDIYNLMPFVTIADVGNMNDARGLWKRITSEQNNTLLLRWNRTLEEQVGYIKAEPNSSGNLPQRYLGDPNRLFARYMVRHSKDFSLGFTMEKDAGEQLAWNPSKKQYGSDFNSFHFYLENKGRLKKLAIGDYQLQFGQGLVLSAGFAVGKGGEPIATVRRANIGIKPFTSVLEGLFFRGAAATYNFGRFDITGFASRKGIDGSIAQATDTIDRDFIDNFATSINIAGFHRTPTELSRKHSIREQIVGGNVVYRSKNQDLETGVLVSSMSYNIPLNREATVYNRFDFNGKQNTNLSYMLNYNWQNFTFFGEAATSSSGGKGAVGGFISSLSSKVDISMVLRDYSPDYHAFYSNAFGEATRVTNERGVYWGIKLKPNPKWTLAAYYDRFKFPWLSFQADAPSEGQEYLVRLNYNPSKQVSLFFQFRNEEKERNAADNTTYTDFLENTFRRNYVINLDVRTIQKLSFKSRVQWSDWKQVNGKPATQGFTVIQDVNIDFGKFSVSNRAALFQTDDFNNRQYVYEKNVLYQFAIPTYFGSGFRAYTLWQYTLSKKIDIWCRYSKTWFRDRNTIGSGLELKKGNQDTDIVVQVRYRFK